jgi:O-antigen biosynthesis protein WbqP
MKTSQVLRVFDVLFAGVGLLVFWPLLIIIYVIGLFDTGKPLLYQVRLGRQLRPFVLVKFRTMKLETAHVASHLASVNNITRFGSVLRQTKVDELPQLWNVLRGEMSLVGPRPNLQNQYELIKVRKTLGVYSVRPGITGLAQINGIDMSTPDALAQIDAKMLSEISVVNYFMYIIMTLTGSGSGDGVRSR